MTSHVLNNSGALGKQTAPGVYLLQANLHHYQTIVSGLARFPVAEGVQIDVLVAPSNDLDNTRWAVMSCSYSSANGGQLTRVYTTEGSNGTGDVDNFYTDDQSIKIIAINDGSQNRRDIVLPLQKGWSPAGAFGAGVTGHNTTTYIDGTASSYLITPKSDRSVLLVNFFCEVRAGQGGISGQSYRCAMRMYHNDLGTYQNSSDTISFGGALFPADENMFLDLHASSGYELTQSSLNAVDGDWEIRPRIATTDANTEVGLTGIRIYYEEILRPE